MQNPYQTLGVDRNATPDEIKRAYRRLASQHHPDKGGDTSRFQEIQSAYEALTNPRPQAQQHGSPFGTGGFDFDHIFNMFGARFQQPHQRMQQARMSLWITLTDSAQGGRRTVSIGSNNGTVAADIEIPQGIDDGDSVQYPGIGPGGMDLIVTFRVHPDPRFQRQGLNLTMERTVDIWNLILGTEIEIQDILKNTLVVSVPAGTQPGTLIRLRGRGLLARSGQVGDLLVRIQTSVPKDIPNDLLELIRSKYQK